jgi:hypothetical protein
MADTKLAPSPAPLQQQRQICIQSIFHNLMQWWHIHHLVRRLFTLFVVVESRCLQVRTTRLNSVDSKTQLELAAVFFFFFRCCWHCVFVFDFAFLTFRSATLVGSTTCSGVVPAAPSKTNLYYRYARKHNRIEWKNITQSTSSNTCTTTEMTIGMLTNKWHQCKCGSTIVQAQTKSARWQWRDVPFLWIIGLARSIKLPQISNCYQCHWHRLGYESSNPKSSTYWKKIFLFFCSKPQSAYKYDNANGTSQCQTNINYQGVSSRLVLLWFEKIIKKKIFFCFYLLESVQLRERQQFDFITEWLWRLCEFKLWWHEQWQYYQLHFCFNYHDHHHFLLQVRSLALF